MFRMTWQKCQQSTVYAPFNMVERWLFSLSFRASSQPLLPWHSFRSSPAGNFTLNSCISISIPSWLLIPWPLTVIPQGQWLSGASLSDSNHSSTWLQTVQHETSGKNTKTENNKLSADRWLLQYQMTLRSELEKF